MNSANRLLGGVLIAALASLASPVRAQESGGAVATAPAPAMIAPSFPKANGMVTPKNLTEPPPTISTRAAEPPKEQSKEAAAAAPAADDTTGGEDWITPLAAQENKESKKDKDVPSPPKPGEMTENGDKVSDVYAYAEPVDDAKVMAILSKSGHRLTIGDLSAVNDMLKRLEYRAEVERKLADLQLGISSTPAASSPGMAAPPNFAPTGGTPAPTATTGSVADLAQRYSVVHVAGSKGAYLALIVGQGNRQYITREGDVLEGARVVSVTMDGVKIAGAGGTRELPFVSPFSGQNINVSSNPGL